MKNPIPCYENQKHETFQKNAFELLELIYGETEALLVNKNLVCY